MIRALKAHAKWKWLVETPLTAAWRGRLELCLGAVVTGAAVVALSTMIRPDPEKLAAARGLGPIVSSAPPPSVRDAQGIPTKPAATPELVTAVRDGDTAAMNRAYLHGMPLEGMLALAARSGNKAGVLWVLGHGGDVHDEERSMYSPVLSADAHPEITALLLERGAAEATLDDAAAAVAPHAVDRILASHPNINARWSHPLQAVATSNRGTPLERQQIIVRLLEEGADPNRDGGGPSALSGAVGACEERLTKPGTDCMLVVRLLLAHGARVAGDALAAALTLEADAARATALDTLLAQPIAPGVTATALAEAPNARPDDVKRVLEKGIDWAWHDGETDLALPVLAAIRRGERDYVRTLLDAGAPVDVHYKDGSSTLGAAIDASANDGGDGARIVELLVTRGANVNRRLPDGRTPLFAAAEAGDVRVINFLLARGARVNDIVLDDSVLDAAEQNGHTTAARILHAHGARRAHRLGWDR